MPTDRDDLVQVRVDEHVCIGIGVCVESEPETFLLGDDGVAHVLPGKVLPRDRAERVCRGCPSGAISIVELNDDDDGREELR
jgi:ferredoxin